MSPSDAPLRPLRWGILGTGRILEKFGIAFQLTTGSQAVAVASRDLGRARAAAARLAAARAYGSYAELLADSEIDIVLNALHNGLHCEWTVRALAAGKHVLCEKPLACTSAEADRMFAAAHAHQRWLLEGMMFRFHPQVAWAVQQIRAGTIGEPRLIRCYYLNRGRERSNPRYQRETGGGALLDLGCYPVSMARLLAGTEPRRVAARARFDPAAGIDLTISGELEFAGGLTAQVAASLETEGAYGAEVIGTEGRLVVPHPWLPPAWPAEALLVRRFETAVTRFDRTDTPQHVVAPFMLEIEHLAECVRRNQPPTYPPGLDAETESRANLRVLEALARAARDERPVDLVSP